MNEHKQFRLASKAHGRKFLGLLSGVANHTDISVDLLRIAFCASLLFYGIPFFLYFVLAGMAWLLFGYEED